VIAVVSAKPVLDLDALIDQSRPPAFLVVLDGVEDPRNLGAILRSVEAAGGDGVVLPERHSSALSETVGRASAGALEHVRVARVGNLAQSLEHMKERGFWIVGFDATGGTRWDAVDFKRPIAIVLGGEGRGIRRLVRERCDEVVSIPMFGHLGSLNVSVAAGIAVFEVVRQRGLVPSLVKPIPLRAASAVPRQIVGPSFGDAEQDPGAIPPETAPGEPGDAEGPSSPADDESPAATIRFHHEELAWGSRPPEAGLRRGRRAEADGRGRHGLRNAPGAEVAREPQQARGPHGSREGPAGRRRRRRRRGGLPDYPSGQARPAAPPTGEPPRAQGSASGGEIAPGPGRRRGRRRRHRR
jgi:23S rRNA (guanosine2251-2'-O)-methyltransferase